MKGVKKVVSRRYAVAVVADTWWHAKTALDALPIVWDEGEKRQGTPARRSRNGWRRAWIQARLYRQSERDAKSSICRRREEVEAVTTIPTRITPRWSDERHALYTSDNARSGAARKTARRFRASAGGIGLPADKCDVHKADTRGGFGRRGQTDYVRRPSTSPADAGHAIKLCGRVKRHAARTLSSVTQWQDDRGARCDNNLTRCTCASPASRSCSACGRRRSSTARIRRRSPASIPMAMPRWDIRTQSPDRTFDAQSAHHPGFWRGVNVNHNELYLECFMDELAHAPARPARVPSQALDKHPKNLAVLNAVAEKSAGTSRRRKGVYRGLAQYMGYGSYVAARRNLRDRRHQIKVHRIAAATGPGLRRQSGADRAQIAGSFVYGPDRAVLWRMHVKDGRIEQTNFDTYNSMRIAEMPKVNRS